MSDWIVWPIFLIQFLVLGILLLPSGTVIFKIKIETYIIIFLILVCLLILISLYHDSTDVLKLYF